MNLYHHPDMGSKVGDRGQITIEKAIREELSIYAGDETIQRVEDGRIVIERGARPPSPIAGRGASRQARANADRRIVGRDSQCRVGDARPGSQAVIGVDTSVIVRYLVGTPMAQARRATALIDDDGTEIGVSLIALAETAHVLRTQYGIEQRDILDSLIELIQRENVHVLGLRTDILVAMLVRARGLPGRPIPDAMLVAASVAADALPLATFDRGQPAYGVPTREP